MKIWEVAFSVLMKKEGDWSKIDTYTVLAETIEEAIEKCKQKAGEVWRPREVRVDEAKLSVEVDVE